MTRETLRLRNDCRGFTLVELMIALVFFAMVILGFLYLISHSLELGKMSHARLALINEMRRVTETMRRQVDTYGINTITSSTTWANTALTGAVENEAVSLSFPSGTSAKPLPVQITISGTYKGKTVVYMIDTMVIPR